MVHKLLVPEEGCQAWSIRSQPASKGEEKEQAGVQGLYREAPPCVRPDTDVQLWNKSILQR